MAREGITYEQVATTAEALLAAGKRPTIALIRENLGTGSYATIHKHMVSWQASRPQVTEAARVFSPALTTALVAEIERAASQVRTELDVKLGEAQAASSLLATTVEQLEAEKAELLSQVVSLSTARDKADGAAAAYASEIERLRTELAEERKARATAEQHAAILTVKLEAVTFLAEERAREIQRLTTKQ